MLLLALAESLTKSEVSNNSFSVLNEVSKEVEKENVPPKRVRKPTTKVAENLNIGIEGLSKGVETGSEPSKRERSDVTFLECKGLKQFS